VKRTCYFHAGCPDGFGAAWAVWRAWGRDVRFVARGHEDPFDPRPHEGELVVFVDIAPPPESLDELSSLAAQLVVLDHHVSARDRFAEVGGLASLHSRRGHRIHFDLDHSGAVLAWQHFHAPAAAPPLLLYVEDQDLWSWALPDSEAVNAALGSYPREFDVWERLAARPPAELAAEGEPILRSNRMEVERSLQSAAPVAIGERRAEAVNARYQRAQIGHALAKRAAYGLPWGVVYRITSDRVDVSLYSIGDLDVARIATRYGGGGHRNAAGFHIPLRRWIEDFV
jgi:oligoribonuclease NrnB/cAMP/cGMP phosphodiesterase (DHH superfamily)